HRGAAAPVFPPLEGSLAAGQAVVLTGANGAGKSTLLELLAGVRRCAEGRVELSGRPLRAYSWRERSARVGYLPQWADGILHAPTVAEELLRPLRARGLSAAEAAQRTDLWLERIGLSHASGRFPHLLSRGERQRLALAAAMIGGPALLALDEPFAGQDLAQVAAVLRLCRAFLDEDRGRGLIVATHDVDLVSSFVDEVWRLGPWGLTVESPAGPSAGDGFRWTTGPLGAVASPALGGGT
ncbi:MAG: ABC transporter ATP-binding protein, partial [SAR324 cluster bacterium]|nr:ABC transporter ATP-binding protein [SAR324 cluster bacterium]